MLSKIFTVLVVVFTFISCNSDDGLFDELNRNRQLWTSKNIKDYSWNERLSCFCAGVLERDVFVENDVKIKVVFNEDDLYSGQTYDDVFSTSKTVEDAFDFIENFSEKNEASLNIEYDEIYGFPTVISVDYGERIADGGISYFYSNFSKEN